MKIVQDRRKAALALLLGSFVAFSFALALYFDIFAVWQTKYVNFWRDFLPSVSSASTVLSYFVLVFLCLATAWFTIHFESLTSRLFFIVALLLGIIILSALLALAGKVVEPFSLSLACLLSFALALLYCFSLSNRHSLYYQEILENYVSADTYRDIMSNLENKGGSIADLSKFSSELKPEHKSAARALVERRQFLSCLHLRVDLTQLDFAKKSTSDFAAALPEAIEKAALANGAFARDSSPTSALFYFGILMREFDADFDETLDLKNLQKQNKQAAACALQILSELHELCIRYLEEAERKLPEFATAIVCKKVHLRAVSSRGRERIFPLNDIEDEARALSALALANGANSLCETDLFFLLREEFALRPLRTHLVISSSLRTLKKPKLADNDEFFQILQHKPSKSLRKAVDEYWRGLIHLRRGDAKSARKRFENSRNVSDNYEIFGDGDKILTKLINYCNTLLTMNNNSNENKREKFSSIG